MEESRFIDLGNATVELRLDPMLTPRVLRAFAGRTPHDAVVDALDVKLSPLWLNSCVRLLRWYRRSYSVRSGHRCIFDPSCSRYAELAIRKHGFLRGVLLTANRLRRCSPNRGGVDLP